MCVHRIAVTALLLAGLLPASAFAQERPRLRVHLDLCRTGSAGAHRVAVFSGSMPAVAGTARMAMRFDLYERRSGARGFARVRLPALGRVGADLDATGGSRASSSPSASRVSQPPAPTAPSCASAGSTTPAA